LKPSHRRRAAANALDLHGQDEGFRKLARGEFYHRFRRPGDDQDDAHRATGAGDQSRARHAAGNAPDQVGQKIPIDFLKDLGRSRKNADKIAARVYDVAALTSCERRGKRRGSAANDRGCFAAVKPKQPVLPEQVFDFSIVRKVSDTLK